MSYRSTLVMEAKLVLNLDFLNWHTSFILIHAFLSGGSRGRQPWSSRNIPWSAAISDSSAGSTPRKEQARSEVQSLHLLLGRPPDRFSVDVANRTCLVSLSWDILDHSRMLFFSLRRFVFLVSHFGLWNISAICLRVVLKLTATMFITLYFQTFWPKLLNFFQSFQKHFGLWPKKTGRINVTGISRFGEPAGHSGLCALHRCAFCREVSHRKFVANIPSLQIAHGIVLFQSLTKSYDHRWGSEQRPIYKLTASCCLKAPVLWPRNDKGRCVFFTKPCIKRAGSAYHHSWIHPRSWTSPPAAVFCRLLEACTALAQSAFH